MNAFDHVDLMIAYAADHREQLLAEAAADRLLREVRGGHSAGRLHQRMLDGVGAALIYVGQRLKMTGHSSHEPLR